LDTDQNHNTFILKKFSIKSKIWGDFSGFAKKKFFFFLKISRIPDLWSVKNFCGGGSRDGQRHMLLTLSSLLLYRGNKNYIIFFLKNWTNSPPKELPSKFFGFFSRNFFRSNDIWLDKPYVPQHIATKLGFNFSEFYPLVNL
jgi:hypothetical protein